MIEIKAGANSPDGGRMDIAAVSRWQELPRDPPSDKSRYHMARMESARNIPPNRVARRGRRASTHQIPPRRTWSGGRAYIDISRFAASGTAVERQYIRTNGRLPIIRMAGAGILPPRSGGRAVRTRPLEIRAGSTWYAWRAPRTCRRFAVAWKAESCLQAVFIRGANDPDGGFR